MIRVLLAEDQAMDGVLATTLAELEAELLQVAYLRDLARRVYDAGGESKFEKLREVLLDPRYNQEKMIIFTEHRDTLDYLVQRLAGLGFTDQLVQIHGGACSRRQTGRIDCLSASGLISAFTP